MKAEAMPSLVVMAIRKRLKPLLVSSGMTVVGTLPLLFARRRRRLHADHFLRRLLGDSGSLASTFLVLPALAVAFPGAFRALRFANEERRIP